MNFHVTERRWKEQCRGTVTLHYSRYLRLLSSSKVRSTTSAGEAHVCCGVTAVHDCAGREPTYCGPEPCFQEETLWITPPRGWAHLACSWTPTISTSLSEEAILISSLSGALPTDVLSLARNPGSKWPASRSSLVLQVAPVFWPPTELLCSWTTAAANKLSTFITSGSELVSDIS